MRRLSLSLIGIAVYSGALLGTTSATEIYQYDALGRLRSAQLDSGKLVQYEYDNAGNRKTVTAVLASQIPVLTSASPNFGSVSFSAIAPTRSLTFRNDGNTAMTLTGLSGLPALVTLVGNNCTSVAPGASCAMSIRMGTTSSVGQVVGTIFTQGATTNASFSVTGAVTGVVSRWSVLSVAFGSVTINQSATAQVTLYNDGYGATANWSNALTGAFPAGFSGNTSACSSVAPGASCSVLLTFSPTAVQSYSTSTISPNGVAYANNTLALSGAGIAPTAPAISVSPLSASASSTEPSAASVTVSVSNAGQTATTLTAAVSGGLSVSGSPFICAAAVSAAQPVSCGNVTVSSPTSRGSYSGSLTFTSSAGGSTPSVAVNLTVNPPATPPPTLSLTRTPSPMVANRPYTVNWSTTDATNLAFSCVSPSGGYVGTGNVSTGPNLSATGTADPAWVGKPSSCTWTVTGPGGVASYQETLSTAFPPPALTLSCTSNSPTTTPTPATATCSVGNATGGPVGSITYSIPYGTTRSGGPTTCTAFANSCGPTFTVTTGTSAGIYTGDITVSPDAGAGATDRPPLVVNGMGVFAYSGNSGHSSNGAPYDRITFTITNSGSGTITGVGALCSGASFHNYGNLASTTLAPNASISVTCEAAASGGYNAAKVTMTGTNASNSGVAFGPY